MTRCKPGAHWFTYWGGYATGVLHRQCVHCLLHQTEVRP